MSQVLFKTNEVKSVQINEHEYDILNEALTIMTDLYMERRLTSSDPFTKLDCQEKINYAGRLQLVLYQQIRPKSA